MKFVGERATGLKNGRDFALAAADEGADVQRQGNAYIARKNGGQARFPDRDLNKEECRSAYRGWVGIFLCIVAAVIGALFL